MNEQTIETMDMMDTEEQVTDLVSPVDTSIELAADSTDGKEWLYVAGTMLAGYIVGRVVEKHVAPAVKRTAKKAVNGVKKLLRKDSKVVDPDADAEDHPIAIDPDEVKVE